MPPVNTGSATKGGLVKDRPATAVLGLGPPGLQSRGHTPLDCRSLHSVQSAIMDVNTKSPTYYRPALPPEIEAAARRAGAGLNLSPRDFVFLAVRDGLRRFGELPDAFALSVDELDCIEEATR